MNAKRLVAKNGRSGGSRTGPKADAGEPRVGAYDVSKYSGGVSLWIDPETQ